MKNIFIAYGLSILLVLPTVGTANKRLENIDDVDNSISFYNFKPEGYLVIK